MGTSWIASVSRKRGGYRRRRRSLSLEGLSHLVNIPGLDNNLLFDGMGLTVKGLDLLLNGEMILLGRHHLQDDCCIKK
jgi:hypothetical protein